MHCHFGKKSESTSQMAAQGSEKQQSHDYPTGNNKQVYTVELIGTPRGLHISALLQ